MEIYSNNGIRGKQILESVESAKLNESVVAVSKGQSELVKEVPVKKEGEVFVTAKNTQSAPVKSLAAVPRMPQQSAPRNATQEEAAGVPSSVATPNFVIPPHLMGRNVDNPAEDMIGSGRKLQKPRLGVRIPYRNLTSQIVTQDEIAQELLERSLKKHPVHDTPEGGDVFFALKLTQRLANRLSPATAPNTNISVNEIESIAGKSGQFQQNSVNNSLLPSGYTLVPDTTAIPDEKELLAILEGNAESEWGNPPVLEGVVKSPLVNTNKPPILIEAGSSVDQVSVHSTPPKLDPSVEREMALKQLMELPRRSKKKKPAETQPKTPKSPQKGRKKEQQDQSSLKKSDVISVKVEINSQDSENNNRASINGDSKIETDSSIKPRQGRKRKLPDQGEGNAKKQKMTKKKKTEMSDGHSVMKSSNKTEETNKKPKVVKIQKKTTVVTTVNGNSASAKRRKAVGTNSIDPSSNPVSAEHANLNKSPIPSTSGMSTQEIGDSDDEFSQSMLLHLKKTGTPPKTYSPRKRAPRPPGAIVTSKQNTVAAILAKEIVRTLNESTPNSSSKSEGSSKVNLEILPSVTGTPSKKIEDSLSKSLSASTSKTTATSLSKNTVSSSVEISKVQPSSSSGSTQMKVNNSVITPQSPKKINTSVNGQSSADSKRKRMKEVDRLLMDEGAINLLYEVEQGDMKRRSATLENDSGSPKRKVRSPLKSVRRQKKDLLLKTRLVKNAVMRLSSSTPSPAAAITLRVRRSLGPPTLQLATGQSRVDSLQRKRSLDSRESLRSPPPLTPVDPPSPAQSFSFPPRLQLPAEASRIIRRHSSSSTFSSRSTSPNLQHRLSIDGIQSPENAENKPDNHYSKNASNVSIPSSSKSSSDLSEKKRTEVRKKGVPIFIRKLEERQTYKGKKKRETTSSADASLPHSAEKLLEMKCKELKMHNKVHVDSGKKTGQTVDSKKKIAVIQPGPPKKMSSTIKMKLKAQMSKNFQKGMQKAKSNKLKKAVPEGKTKKKEDSKQGEKHGTSDVEMPDLTSCLAAVATEFAAEAESHKKVVALRRNSHDSSPSSSHSSRSPNYSQPAPALRKESKEVPPPLSPNASSYSTLIKTLETESQRQKKREEEVTKQRSSVRQNAGTYHYKEICLRRYDNLVQIILTPASTKLKNSLNVQVLRELREALSQLKRDDGCRVVLLTSAGSSFCQGIDFHCLLHTNTDKRKAAAQELAQALKEFLKSLALFSKPLVAGVHGAAVGLGVTMLPFFDMVFASDKATFYTPYAKLGQVPEGAAILTLPHMLGNAVTSELLFGCRKLTASEALHFGLVTRILWPDRFQEELIPIVRTMASQSAQSMEATKALLRHSLRTKLEAALDLEVPLLVRHWITNECQKNFQRFLEEGDVGLQRQRIDP